MITLLRRYTRWLHTKWPAGTVEQLPESGDRGVTQLPGVRIVGDLTGIPLLKFSSDSGAKAVHAILAEPDFKKGGGNGTLDLAIVGAGVAGIAAAIEAQKAGLKYVVLEATQNFSTIVNFPRAKPIYTYPSGMTPDGGLQFSSDIKEDLLEEVETQRKAAGIEPVKARIERIERKGDGELLLHHAGGEQTRARRAIVAIGRSGNHRRLGVPGEELGKVYNRLHDPRDYTGRNALVVGGGDTALETAIALAACGAAVTVSYRKPEFSRPKPDNVEKLEMLRRDPSAPVQVEQPTSERVTSALTDGMRSPANKGSITLQLGSEVTSISEESVTIRQQDGAEAALPNDVVFTMIGREAPLEFFRRSGIPIRNERTTGWWVSLILVLLACIFVYHWKKSGTFIPIAEAFSANRWFPFNVPDWWATLGPAFSRPANLLGTLRTSIGEAGFYYSIAYCTCVIVFGLRRIRRRPTPYIKLQTTTLICIQCIPLFLLPYILLPWAGNNGWFDSGFARVLADNLFPVVTYGHGREYWRAFGLILAWPLFFWNVFTEQPLWLWLGISAIQTFVFIPLIIRRWGKGAYCGWICSCGALAETLGDEHRHKMPHGPGWNRLNMVGQVFLAAAFFLLITRILAWIFPGSPLGAIYTALLSGIPVVNYVWFVDLLWAGILGVGLYWHFSGRVWCRFACPLAALMHIYTRWFSRYRIFAEKKKCISCNVCTTVCHQGIDVMNFANKGIPMEDPQCVRCSACVTECPTGVLAFGRYDSAGNTILDRLSASPVRIKERS